jgi:hypothetical protein
VIDDMLPQESWPDGHDEKVRQLLTHLANDRRFQIVKLSWASGIVIAVRVDETARISP